MKYFILLMLFFVSNITLPHNNTGSYLHETVTRFIPLQQALFLPC
jgi:hypothetical protein